MKRFDLTRWAKLQDRSENDLYLLPASIFAIQRTHYGSLVYTVGSSEGFGVCASPEQVGEALDRAMDVEYRAATEALNRLLKLGAEPAPAPAFWAPGKDKLGDTN